MKYAKPEAVISSSVIGTVHSSACNKWSSLFIDLLQDMVPFTFTATSPAYEADE